MRREATIAYAAVQHTASSSSMIRWSRDFIRGLQQREPACLKLPSMVSLCESLETLRGHEVGRRMTETKKPAYAEGGNYRVTVEGGIAFFRVWKRPDVSREVGAAFAREMVGVMQSLAAEPTSKVRGVLMDLRDATTTWGPVTQAAVSEMFACLEAVEKRIAVVTSNETVQLLSVSSVVRKFAPNNGRAFASYSSAERWSSARLGSR